jgi:glycosyltransferase involved in cell wall biosynthesis
MRFPAPSETFACTDVRVLREAGVDVSVHTLRSSQGDAAALLEERRMAGLALSEGTFLADVRGLASVLSRPVLAARLLMWLVQTSWKRPLQLMVSFLLVPRSMGILADLERQRPDVIHLFWGHYPCLVGYLVQTTLPHSVLSLFLGAYDLTRRYGGTGCVARRADLVSTHAQWNFPAIEALGVPRDRIHLAYRGIDPTYFNGERVRKITHRIVSAGRLDEGKGMDDVLRVFHQIHTQWPDATLRVLGQGPERAGLERLSRSLGIDRAVRFLGHVRQEDVASELSEAEIFLHMSWEETERLPNVVKEAMASQCLCVVADTSGIDELVRDGQHGFVVPKRNVEAAAGRVDDVFSGRADVGSMLRGASDHIAHRFDVSESMRSYRRHWQDALARRKLGLRPPPITGDGLHTGTHPAQRLSSD